MTPLASIARLLARSVPIAVEPSTTLRRALSFTGSDLDAETVVSAGYALGVVAFLVGVIGLAASPLRVDRRGLLGLCAVAGGVTHAVHWAPRYRARLRRASALGEAPGLIGRAVLRLRIDPTVERAADFAADTGRGPLADSLAAHVRRTRGGPTAGLTAFDRTWGDSLPELRRAIGLLAAATDEPPSDRARTLDRALATVLEGTEDRMASFAGSVSGPTTALYAFGVLLPLALVAVLPAASVAGLDVGVGVVALVYDLLLPAGLLCASAWLLARRPVAFRPPRVSRSHPDVPDRRWPPLVAVLLGVCAAAALVARTDLDWAAPLVAVGGGVGAGLVAWYRPVLAVRERARAIEAGLTDAAHLVGTRVRDGESVEAAVAAASTEVSGETGQTLAEAAAVADRLRVDVEDAFLGEHGALATVPSPRARSVATLFALAGEEGQPAGRALVATAEHLDDLATVERAACRDLAQVTGTLRSTALAFGPLVAGATVAMATGLDGGTTLGSEPLPAADLGLAIGVYVLALSSLLAGLAAALEAGLDSTLIGYRVGRAACLSVVVYLGALVGTGAVL